MPGWSIRINVLDRTLASELWRRSLDGMKSLTGIKDLGDFLRNPSRAKLLNCRGALSVISSASRRAHSRYSYLMLVAWQIKVIVATLLHI